MTNVAVITGASRGIGLACVDGFLRANYRVIGIDRSSSERSDAQYSHVISDFSSQSGVELGLAGVLDLTDHVQVLVNNAGVHPPLRTIDDATVDTLSSLMQVNVFAAFEFTRRLLPMIRSAKGSIVNISSLVGSIGQEKSVEYCMTKGAILSMTKALAIDESRYGVRVNSVSPGAVLTPLAKELNSPEELTAIARWSWLNGLGTAEQVAETVMFLGSPSAAFITGEDLAVSGGAELGYGQKANW